MFRRKAFLQWYEGEDMESNMNNLVSEYSSIKIKNDILIFILKRGRESIKPMKEKKNSQSATSAFL